MTNTIDMIESIVNEWSKNIPSGIVDVKKETHLYELLKVLDEKIDNKRVVNAVMENIREQMREDY
jgi:RNA binding exosome subunit